MSEENRLPIKVVPDLKRDHVKPDSSTGGGHKVFGEVTSELRERLSAEVIGVRDCLRASLDKFPRVPAVAKAKLRPDAVAKSHRPTYMFSEKTCPIIGAEGLGELLISVTAAGLERLAKNIERNTTKQGIANISTLESIERYTPSIDIPQVTEEGQDITAKVKLHQHRMLDADIALEYAFHELLRHGQNPSIEEIHYGPGLRVFRVTTTNQTVLEELSQFIGTQSIGPFPTYFPVQTTAIALRNVQLNDFPPPEIGVQYPVVGVIDSGTAVGDPHLSPWVVGREEYIPVIYQNNTHGSFVCDLIAQGKGLNHNSPLFPSCKSKVLDVVALGNNGTNEDELLAMIEDALGKYPEVKFWNLSLGTNKPCDDRVFSDFAIAIDRLQDEYGVTFLLAAGNYQQRPLRGWPPEDLQGQDRICAPADSLRSIVVGSLAHLDHGASRVKAGEPSPFTRRGPGPLYLPKPEICHVGGNCDSSGICSQVGVLSIDGKGNIAEDIGTSFATPLASTLAANVHNRIAEGSHLLTRALIVHSAALKAGKVDKERLDFVGFGVPGDVDEILNCESWRATLVFELPLKHDTIYEKVDFPMPRCLYVDDNTVRADVLMTLAYKPDLDASFGSEYCRSNVEVSLGTYDIDPKDGKRHHSGEIPVDPNLGGKGYEKDLVAHGFKWSPVKVYRRNMARGVAGGLWRLEMSVHHRSGHSQTEALDAVLVITVADPLKKAPVYNDMVVRMNQLGWAAYDLPIRSRLRT